MKYASLGKTRRIILHPGLSIALWYHKLIIYQHDL
jgi:hypothetical protein